MSEIQFRAAVDQEAAEIRERVASREVNVRSPDALRGMLAVASDLIFTMRDADPHDRELAAATRLAAWRQVLDEWVP